MPVKVEPVYEDKCQLGESPFWDENSQSIYYVDIFGKTVHKYSPSTKTYVKAVVGDETVSFIIPIEGQDDTFLIGYGNEIAKLTWDGLSDKIGSLETVVELKNTEEKTHRWNDGKADPCGRLWAGVAIPKKGGGFVPNAGTLYTLTSNKTLDELITGVSLSNGLTWDDKLKKFYYLDTIAAELYQYDYKDTELSNKTVIYKFGKDDDPDGMTIDSTGNLWIALYSGGKVVKINPRQPNILQQTIDIPAKHVTCVEFAGPNYDELYVTTAGVRVEGGRVPEGGLTYKITGLGVRGVQARKVKF